MKCLYCKKNEPEYETIAYCSDKCREAMKKILKKDAEVHRLAKENADLYLESEITRHEGNLQNLKNEEYKPYLKLDD